MRRVLFSILIIALASGGCAQLTELGKKIVGTSTEALEKARIEAIAKTYACSFDECFNETLNLNRLEKDKEISDENGEDEPDGFFDVFMKDPIKGHIVVMGIAGHVDTTEVGIFFSRIGMQKTRIEVSSLSTGAKQKVSEALFNHLDQYFVSE